ncbi:TMF-regulated nuclear protein 1 [Nannospalax galili]|uniref:TMF-regulated nuclear protein 1 n=1 Tax=Nannospalax galili TaxID=1026970 RepID=UPI00111BF2FB|nr:TMF-regulated nuclear protein 1 [Nannospalax galili]
MPGCRISACGPGAQEGTAEPGSPPPPPRESLPSLQLPPPSLTLTPTPTQSPPLREAAGEPAGAAEGQELQRWRQAWGAGRLRRGHGPEPDSPFRRSPPRGPASPQR